VTSTNPPVRRHAWSTSECDGGRTNEADGINTTDAAQIVGECCDRFYEVD